MNATRRRTHPRVAMSLSVCLSEKIDGRESGKNLLVNHDFKKALSVNRNWVEVGASLGKINLIRLLVFVVV